MVKLNETTKYEAQKWETKLKVEQKKLALFDPRTRLLLGQWWFDVGLVGGQWGNIMTVSILQPLGSLCDCVILSHNPTPATARLRVPRPPGRRGSRGADAWPTPLAELLENHIVLKCIRKWFLGGDNVRIPYSSGANINKMPVHKKNRQLKTRHWIRQFTLCSCDCLCTGCWEGWSKGGDMYEGSRIKI